MSKKKVVIDQNICIGCNSCCLIDPDTFELDPVEYKARIKKQPDPIGEATMTAISSCPVGAISIVEED